MGTVISIRRSQFSVGELVHHRLFDYRGVIIDVDPTCQAGDEWYETVARSRPPRDKPWYHVLVHGAEHVTYVAERNLQSDDTGDPVSHPLVDAFFREFRDGRYVTVERAN